MNAKKTAARKDASANGTALHDWMMPVSSSTPCGPDLEYDPEFVVLAAKVAARTEAQYGDFVGSPEPVNWSDVDRDCRRLMIRSKDIRFAVLYTRCRTRLANAGGLAEGLALLAAWLDVFPDTLHPQPGVDSDRDAALEIRMNALQSLTDADGLLADVREIELTRSTAARLQVRDVERAFAHPRSSDALAPESVTRQLDDLRAQQPARLAGFEEALRSLESIAAWCDANLGEYVPDFTPLRRLLPHLTAGDGQSDAANPATAAITALLSEGDAQPAEVADSAATGVADDACAPTNFSTLRQSTKPSSRQDALELIRDARHWFEHHEPSSPIPVLLRRAEQFVGRRYAEVVAAIPSELLAQWDSEG